MNAKETEFQLKCALVKMQMQTIGLFKPKFAKEVEMVIEDNGGHLKTISIGSLGGLMTLHINSKEGLYKKFPEGKSMSEMMQDPFAFDAFVKSFY